MSERSFEYFRDRYGFSRSDYDEYYARRRPQGYHYQSWQDIAGLINQRENDISTSSTESSVVEYLPNMGEQTPSTPKSILKSPAPPLPGTSPGVEVTPLDVGGKRKALKQTPTPSPGLTTAHAHKKGAVYESPEGLYTPTIDILDSSGPSTIATGSNVRWDDAKGSIVPSQIIFDEDEPVSHLLTQRVNRSEHPRVSDTEEDMSTIITSVPSTISSGTTGTSSSSSSGYSRRRRRKYSYSRRALKKKFKKFRYNEIRYPRWEYARAYIKRGTPFSRSTYGESWNSATEDQKAMRKAHHFYGKGGYWGRTIGAYLGDKAGDLISAGIMKRLPVVGGALSMLGDKAADLHRRYTGQGMYSQLVSNDIVNGGQGNPAPSFAASSDGTIRLSNREYVCDIFAPASQSAFNVETWTVNPGIEKTFPWLCQIAENYEEYTLHQCIFTFKSTVADFAASTGQVGQIIMATQYNTAAQPFGDKQTMMQYAFACTGKTSQDMLQGVECDPRQLSGSTGKFVRNGPLPVGALGDLNMYDHAILNLAVTDVPTGYLSQQMGELWVSYTIELRKPKFVTSNGWGITRDFFAHPQVIHRAPFDNGSQAMKAQQNNLGCILGFPVTPSTTTVQQAGFGNLIDIIPLVGATGAGTDIYCFSIRIPNWYSGNLKILYSMRSPNNLIRAMDCFATPGSRVRLINDIPVSTTNGAITSWAGTTTFPVNVQADLNFEMHLRVDIPMGAPNILVFKYATGYASTSVISGFTLDIQEYNTQFNLRQDGSNDRVSLLNYNSNQPVVTA